MAITFSLKKLNYLVSLDQVNEVMRRAIQIIKWVGHVKEKRFCWVSGNITWFEDYVLSVNKTHKMGSESAKVSNCISVLSFMKVKWIFQK